MLEVIKPEPGSTPTHAGRRLWPRTVLGRIAIVFTVVALASVFVLPLTTMVFRNTYPVVDTWVMPAILVTLMDTAAILNLLAVWLQHERSVFSIVALVLTALAGLFFTFMVVGEAIICV